MGMQGIYTLTLTCDDQDCEKRDRLRSPLRASVEVTGQDRDDCIGHATGSYRWVINADGTVWCDDCADARNEQRTERT